MGAASALLVPCGADRGKGHCGRCKPLNTLLPGVWAIFPYCFLLILIFLHINFYIFTSIFHPIPLA
jgi:hypothetical protein